ncbi:MAG: histidine phosphatase family protein [bacterium]|nr:histidine phosphatase family protein [bacterium]
MTSLVLIPWAGTAWGAGSRFASRTPLPLSPEGRTQAGAWGDALAARELAALYSSREQTSVETAEYVVARSEAKHRLTDELRELDYGLWEGLTEAELHERFPRLGKRWLNDPGSVSLPEGDTVVAAAERVAAMLRQITRKHGNETVGAIVAPAVLALGRCALEDVPIRRLRDFTATEPVWYELDLVDRKTPAVADA